MIMFKSVFRMEKDFVCHSFQSILPLELTDKDVYMNFYFKTQTFFKLHTHTLFDSVMC